MFELFINWYKKRFANPHVISFVALLAIFGLTLYFFHQILTPILIAIVCAYCLNWPTQKLQYLGLSRTMSASVISLLFITIMVLSILFVLPIIWQQSVTLLSELPAMLTRLHSYLMTLPQRFPELTDVGFFDMFIANLKTRLIQTGDSLLQFSVASIVGLFSIALYIVIVPLLTFFLLKDKDALLNKWQSYLPQNREILDRVTCEMNDQISNYILGKVVEVLILAVVSFIVFWYLGLSYALLLAVGVGLSVIIPYVGMLVITLPVVGVALYQFGISPEFWSVVTAYIIIQVLDGNVLSPLLFSEAVNLSPFTIIVSVIIFGGLWGFWGVFFAIPLATLIKAIANAWPEPEVKPSLES